MMQGARVQCHYVAGLITPLWLDRLTGRQGRQEAFLMCMPLGLACPGDPAFNRPKTHDPCGLSQQSGPSSPEFSALPGRLARPPACLSGGDQRQAWGSPTATPISDLHRHGLSPSLAGNVPAN